MCGIAGVYRRTSKPIPEAETLICALLREIDHRGGDATGISSMMDDGTHAVEKYPCAADDFIWRRRRHGISVTGNERSILLHTRFATQGSKAFPENNHPVTGGGWALIHNGVLDNDYEIKRGSGLLSTAEVDSEAILLQLRSTGFGLTGAAAALERIEGTLAIAAHCQKAPRELILARGEHSPLCLVITEKLVVWASTEEALLKAWKRAYGTAPGAERVFNVKEGTVLHLAADQPAGVLTYEPPVRWRHYARPVSKTADKLLAAATETMLEGKQASEADDFGQDRCSVCDNWEYADRLELAKVGKNYELACSECIVTLDQEGLIDHESTPLGAMPRKTERQEWRAINGAWVEWTGKGL